MMIAWAELQTDETRKIERLMRKTFPRTDAYRYNSASIRVRVIDPALSGKNMIQREKLVLPLIRKLPEEIQRDIVVLLLLAADEADQSVVNLEFESPTPSRL